jgi:methionyl-tRNA synthetase
VTIAATTPTAAAAAPTYLKIEDFAKLNLRVGTIIEASAHPNADKLLVLKVDLGTKQIQVCAGIKTMYAPETLVGKQVVAVENLEPRQLRGVLSQGMLLAASNEGEGPILLSPERPIKSGSQVK